MWERRPGVIGGTGVSRAGRFLYAVLLFFTATEVRPVAAIQNCTSLAWCWRFALLFRRALRHHTSHTHMDMEQLDA